MAAHQPSKKDVALFSTGVPRSLVVAEVGAPVTTETKAGKRVEVYAFTQGYSKAARVSRTIGHGAADVFDARVCGRRSARRPRRLFNGKHVAYEVTYDSADRVESVVRLKK